LRKIIILSNYFSDNLCHFVTSQPQSTPTTFHENPLASQVEREIEAAVTDTQPKPPHETITSQDEIYEPDSYIEAMQTTEAHSWKAATKDEHY
jgi:hypothetical protein